MIKAKTLSKYLLFIALGIVLSNFALAATINLDTIFHPFRDIDVASFYMNYRQFIDAIIYLILFLSLTQIAFLKVYKDNKKEAKLVAVAVSLALTISMVILESNTGFYLGMLEPIALIIFLLVIAILLYNLFLGLFTEDDGKNISAGLTFLIIYGLLIVPFGKSNQWIDQNAPLLSAILAMAALVAFVYLLIKLFGLLGGKGDSKGSGSSGSSSIPNSSTPTATTPTSDTPRTDRPEREQEKTPPVTPTPTGTNQHIEKLANILPSLEIQARDFAEKGIYITKVHRGMLPNKIETPIDWEEFHKLEEDLYDGIGQFNTLWHAILENENAFNSLTPTDMQTLHNIIVKFAAITGNLLNFRNRLAVAYSDVKREKEIPNNPFK